MRYLRTENSQVIPPPDFYRINHNQMHPVQSRERETACNMNVLKLVSPNQPNLRQLWVRVRVRVRVGVVVRVGLSSSLFYHTILYYAILG